MRLGGHLPPYKASHNRFCKDMMQLPDSQKNCAFAFAAGFLMAAMAFVFQARLIPGVELQTLLRLYHLDDSGIIAGVFVANCLLIAIFLARSTMARWPWIIAGVAAFLGLGTYISLAIYGVTIDGGQGLTFYLASPSYVILGLGAVAAVAWLIKSRGSILQFEHQTNPLRPILTGVSLQITGFVASRILLATSAWAVARPFGYIFPLMVLCLLIPSVLYTTALLRIPRRKNSGEHYNAKRNRRIGLAAGVLLAVTLLAVG